MKNLSIFFTISFLFTLTFMLGAHKVREKNREDVLAAQAQIIGEDIENQFSNYFEQIAFSASQISQLRRTGKLTKNELHFFYDNFLKNNPSVLGINKINQEGIIDDVYPFEANKGALGKMTQSINELKGAKNEQVLWVSVPFNLYQGMPGFGLYVRSNLSQNDWLAFVITSEGFFKQFIPKELGENFNIIFEESTSQKEYLKSADISSLVPLSTIQTQNFPFYNRNFKITIWPKRSNFTDSIPWLWPFFLSFIISILATLAFNSWNKDVESRARLEDLNQLLRLTIHDTSNSLTSIKGYLEMMKDDPEIVPVERLSKHVSYVIDLLDQIKVIKQLSSTDQDWKISENSLLQIVLEVSDVLSDRLQDKKLSLNYNPESLVNVKLNVNKGLFSHSVMGNLITNAIKIAFENSTITIHHHTEDKFHIIEISNQGENISDNELSRLSSKLGTRGEIGIGFGLMIVKQVLELHHGKLELKNTPRGGTIATIFLPLV